MAKTVKITTTAGSLRGRVQYDNDLVNKKGTGIDLYQLVNSRFCGDNDNIATYDKLDDIVEAGKECEKWADIAEKLQELGEGSVVLTNSLDIEYWWTGAQADTIHRLYCGDYDFELVDDEEV